MMLGSRSCCSWMDMFVELRCIHPSIRFFDHTLKLPTPCCLTRSCSCAVLFIWAFVVHPDILLNVLLGILVLVVPLCYLVKEQR
jgi:hypothetical protein